MTDFRALCARMADELDHYRQLLMDDRRETHALAIEARAALAEQPVGQSRRCIYNPVQIAECGGPCEQIGPEACDCGALWVDQDTEQPVGPTDEELCETYRTVLYGCWSPRRPCPLGAVMTNLSPAAQAVLDAAFAPWETIDTPESIAAAALRAAADTVEWSTLDWPADVQLGIIAEELENL